MRPLSDAGPALDGSAAYAGDARAELEEPAPVEHDAAENAACDSQLMAAWSANPPSLGRGTSASVAAYDGVISALLKKYEVPGGALALTRGGKLVFTRGYGWADREARTPAHPDDLFRIASLSKQLTAAAIVVLVEDGKLSLDDAAFDKLGMLEPAAGITRNPMLAGITVRHLLQHLGGWNRDSEAVGDPQFRSLVIARALDLPGPPSTRDVIRYMLDKPLTYTPGSTYCYSNLGYAVLGQIIEQLSGESYESFVQRRVLSPRGVINAALGRARESERRDSEVRYYDYPEAAQAASVFPDVKGSVPWPYGGFHLEAMSADGGWVFSPIDMVRFTLGIDGIAGPDDLFTPASLKQVLANPSVPRCTANGQTTLGSSDYWYGFGLQLNSLGNYWHQGSLSGTATEDVVVPHEGVTWAIFFNSRPKNSSAFFSEFDQVLWDAHLDVKMWSKQDYFDQYSAFSDWLPEDAFEERTAAAAASGEYPARVEGRVVDGTTQYRAQFAPLRAGSARSVRGIDCVAYRELDMQQALLGRSLASVQRFADSSGVTRFQAVWSATTP